MANKLQETYLNNVMKSIGFMMLCLLMIPVSGVGQTVITIEEVVQRALINHPAVLSGQSLIKKDIELKKTSFNPDPLELEYEQEKGRKGFYRVKQEFSLPAVYASQARLKQQQVRLTSAGSDLTISNLRQDIMLQYLEAQYLKALMEEYKYQDSLYSIFADAADRQFEAGQINYLQKLFAETKATEVHNLFIRNQTDFINAIKGLIVLTKTQDLAVSDLAPLSVGRDTSGANNPLLQYYRQAEVLGQKQVRVAQAQSLPGFFLGFQSNDYSLGSLSAIQAGLTIPVWTRQNKGIIKAARYEAEAAQYALHTQQLNARLEIHSAWGQINADRSLLDYYQQKGRRQAEKIIETSYRLFKSGQSDYVSFIRDLGDAFAIRLRQIETLKNHNNKVINLKYLTGQL